MADFLEGSDADIKEVTEQSIKKKEDEMYSVLLVSVWYCLGWL